MKSPAFLIWFALGHLANDWPVAALWLIVPAAGLAMNLSPAEVGLLFTLFSSGAALAYIPAGFLADHVSNRGRLLVATFFWVALGYALAALAPGFWSLAILLTIAGTGNAAWHPIATGVLIRDNKSGRARALGIHAIGGSFAEVLAPLSVGLLLSFLDWRSVLAISVLPSVLMGMCFLWVARFVPLMENKPVDRHEFWALMRAWSGRRGLWIVAMISLYNMSLIALLSMIPLYLAAVHDLAPAIIGTIFATLLIMGALAQPWVGWISDTFGRRPVLATGNGLAALAIATLMFELPFWFMIAMMALGVAALDAIRAAMLATAVDHTDRSESTILGLAFALLDGVGAFGAVLAGMAAGISWDVMFGLAAALACGALVLSVGATFRSPEGGDASTVVGLTSRQQRFRQRKDQKNSVSCAPRTQGHDDRKATAETTRRF
ncbi:MFS transporter [Ruegeria sp. 2205SS24-7]|uniref:MFS transporter n=1 Tax=Ruegeria discodermiae TaxID=3064389 RepID=UPI0027417B5D|nr:MFS transporter [Ruegeria sp. 2205SS24-7]MDP5218448.1 MFS transporter [Ruegeria sp. 2205SS24-7]